jgi:type III secretion protein C
MFTGSCGILNYGLTPACAAAVKQDVTISKPESSEITTTPPTITPKTPLNNKKNIIVVDEPKKISGMEEAKEATNLTSKSERTSGTKEAEGAASSASQSVTTSAQSESAIPQFPLSNSVKSSTPVAAAATAIVPQQPIITSVPESIIPGEIASDRDHGKSASRKVIGDSGMPLIDLDPIETVHSMAFTEGDPADRVPWKTKEYYHFAKNQELKELVRNFCMSQSMDVIVSDSVNDIVNGKFSNVTPYQFWKDVVHAYGLIWFFDGSMLYVYKTNEVKSNVFQMGRDEMRTLVKVITQLGWLSSNVTFRPLETAGILVVSGPPKLMSLLEELSKKVVIERVSNVYDIRSFPLKHAWAYDMSVSYRGGNMNIPGVSSMLQQIVGSFPGPVGEGSVGVNIDNAKATKASEVKALPGTVYHTNESSKKGPESGTDSVKESKNPLNLGEIFVTYDTRLNAVIVKAKRQDMPFIESIIQQLDVPRDAIKIEIAVVSINKSGAMKIGSAMAVNARNSTAAGAGDGAGANTKRIGIDYGIAGAKGSFTLNLDKLFSGYSFSETLNILEEVGNAQHLLRSSVITLDNIGAVINSSETAYVETAGAKAGGLYDVTISTKLVVVPHIIPGEFNAYGAPQIKLLIEVTDGGFEKDSRPGSKGPATTTRSINTEASLFEGQSLFIGGSFKEDHSTSSEGIPFLKDIPLLGYLFGYRSNGSNVNERIYIITPTIVRVDNVQNGRLGRFFTDGQLSGESTLTPDEFILNHPYKKPSFGEASYGQKSSDWFKSRKKKTQHLGDEQDPIERRTRKKLRHSWR